MKRAIITGATGSIGSALIPYLVEQNVEVLVLAREGSARNERILKHPLVEIRYCALDELDTLENTSSKTYDAFFHFAWDGTNGPARNDMYLQNRNVKYALDAVRAAERFGCSVFIGAGSQAEYGRVEGMLTPKTPTAPEMGYGIGKLCAGMMTRELAAQKGMRHVWVRILSIYGPNDGMQSMVMSTIKNLKDGVSPKFTKGEQLWDYLYSGDAAVALYRMAENGKDGSVYVLGSGEARPLATYIKEIRDVVAPDAELTFGEIPYGPKQVMHLQADTSDLERDLGWKPTWRFTDGIAEILKNW